MSATFYTWVLMQAAPPTLSTADAANPSAGTLGRDLAMSINTRELLQSGGDLYLTTGLEAIRQAIDLKLRQVQGEWFLNILDGVPYLNDRILGKSTQNFADVEAVFRAALLEVEGVDAVTSLTLAFDRQTRTLAVSWVVKAALGLLKGQTVV